ncbi:hypothetical protein OQZ33_15855 [Pedobacter sp. MC2016-05]|uniref:ISAon1 family transposase N-terminal region protein n=1 Tax=Pedobacter sp. MC2016-05 TaxID=2994474 RepID=UPI002247159E|nr:hypothetical protein [Pedobacter sp. MC2016-05]MCX2475808.1 hypothetical protein [Pedobacter sp. MC2016-05]
MLYLSFREKHSFRRVFREKLISKGFFDAITARDFPLLGKPCFLKVKRRKWQISIQKRLFSGIENLIADGTKMTTEFAFSKSLLDLNPISCKTLGHFCGVDGKRLEEEYASHLSGFTVWDQLERTGTGPNAISQGLLVS